MTDRIDALKTLFTRLIDSREGYRDAVDHVESATIKGIFTEFMQRRDRDASELRQYLVREGHTLDEDGSILAAAHRTFMDLKDKVTGSEDAATLGEVVRGEKTLLEAYETAIEEAGGTSPEYQFLVEQHASLKSAIQQLETRKDLAA
ncbi:PA2169 family four-helix-bundle protein [Jannaschia sp. W003]|uniref:ferritin-like domain-containing protein n=1 Tax=Jannaschia sp. W003 TaxID=2867012 RepID=UPI0021A631EB|nr:PA2169 family four-helix-bundle protein [Jannaschia sp. W003]UWQ21306.1 PA2169 family four-helix-bundle protein [Jannaschia sp. W003]